MWSASGDAALKPQNLDMVVACVLPLNTHYNLVFFLPCEQIVDQHQHPIYAIFWHHFWRLIMVNQYFVASLLVLASEFLTGVCLKMGTPNFFRVDDHSSH